LIWQQSSGALMRLPRRSTARRRARRRCGSDARSPCLPERDKECRKTPHDAQNPIIRPPSPPFLCHCLIFEMLPLYGVLAQRAQRADPQRYVCLIRWRDLRLMMAEQQHASAAAADADMAREQRLSAIRPRRRCHRHATLLRLQIHAAHIQSPERARTKKER